MTRLFRELRRREVFRTAGLYVGVSWILIEGASVLLPAFDAPEWLFKALIIAAIVGLPVTLVLAWVYDITDKGVVVQGDPTDTIIEPLGGRKTDFVVIGVLTVALIFSLYMNFTGDADDVANIEPLSILIADFDNRTGDALFDGTLEQALQIGIESAPFVAGFRRDTAMSLAQALQSAGATLDEATARLVAVREGIKLVMSGSIEEDRGGYRLYVRAIDPKGGEVLASAEAGAKDKLTVLEAVGALSGDLREQLGDDDLDRKRLVASETFTAKNLEAAHEYAKAQSLQYSGKYDEAMQHYRAALEHDPGFGRAYSGLALSANALGRTDEAAKLWEQALASMDSMTERERLRTLGLYYSVVTRNYPKAIETYEALIEKFPADDSAHNGLAVQKFYALDFPGAREAGARLLDIYPSSVMGRSNYALYAMYASDFDIAVAEAQKVREQDPEYFKAWLPEAIAALARGDADTARQAYEAMQPSGTRGQMTAALGIADAALYYGDFDAAAAALQQGMSLAESAGSQYFLATLRMADAERMLLQQSAGTAEAARTALDTAGGVSRQVPAALIYLQLGDTDAAAAIATELGAELQAQSRAYSALINGALALQRGDAVGAIDAINAGLQRADLWLLRYHLALAYLEAGYFAEALDELTACEARLGEAAALFLDDLPTLRYASALPYWQGLAQSELGMQEAATASFTSYLARRAEGTMADDARSRLN